MSVGFSDKQLEVLKFSNSDYDAIICDGSVRSGKSSVISIAYILWAMKNFDKQNFIIASQSVTAAERNIVKPLLAVRYLHKEFDIKYSISMRALIVTRGKRTNMFYVFGGINEQSYGSVQGITSAGAFLDEVALMPLSFVNQVLARCSVEGAKFWFSCNPEAPTHWFYQDWILKPERRNALYLHFTMDDNPSLSEKVKDRYKKMYDGVFYDRYILGAWVKAEGIIFRKFADDNSKYILKEVPKDLALINVGVDFGGNKSGTTFVATGITNGMRNVVVLEGEKHQGEYSPDEIDKLFVDFCNMVYNKYKLAFNSRCDNAEPILIRGLKNAVIRQQIRTNVKPALKKSVLSRIKLINKLLGLKRFFVMEWVDTVISSLNTQVWDDKKVDTRLDNFTTDVDTADALEYSIEEFMKTLVDIE